MPLDSRSAESMSLLAEKQRLFTVEEYHTMRDIGIFNEGCRVELVDGLILCKSPVGDAHVDGVNHFNRVFSRRIYASVEPSAIVSIQNPVYLNKYSEPKPDVVLIRPDRAGIPEPEDVLLLVEVAVTSLAFDREIRVPRYAAAGIPEVWVVALEEDHVAVYRKPGPAGYAEEVQFGRGEAITIEALPEAGSFAVEDMLRP